MPIDTTVEQAEFSLATSPATRYPPVRWIRPGWILAKLALMALLLAHLVGLVQDYQRIQRLEAEPTPPLKVITKYEAWDRIYSRQGQFIPR
jgi:hypothetical protein